MNNCLAAKQRHRSIICTRHLPYLGVVALILLLALSPQPVNAQAVFGSMVGNVVDASGAAVQNASVKITLTATNDVRTVQTNDAGAYTISTVTPGTYRVEITKEGFRAFVAPEILVNQNNIVRVDAQLQVGAVSERVEVTATTAVLQTDRADIHAEVSSSHLMDLPQPNRTYSGLLELVPGTTPPAGQLNGGTNNPFKSMTFAFNGTGTSGAAVRIEGVNALNAWNRSAQSYVPSIEAIQNVNVATSTSDAESAMSAGVSVNVMLKSGANETHGSVYEYNIISKFEANNFFSNAAGIAKPPHLVDNDFGGYMGGHIIRNKLFYFGSLEESLSRTADSGILSIPNQVQLSGDMSGSANPIYDPLTGTPDGKGRTPFANSFIPANRIDNVVKKIIPLIPPTNYGGAAVVNNYYMNRANRYNLHKIDTKFDYNATDKLRLSARWGKQPYYNFQQPIYGEILGSNGSGTPSGVFQGIGAGNYLQQGHGSTASGSFTYVASPTLVIDATFGHVGAHQLLFPSQYTKKYGADVLGIPGANQGPLPWAGGVPNFEITGFVTMGMSYPALEYWQPLYDFVANVSKIKGSHTIRAGGDVFYQYPNHIEIRENRFIFNGAQTTLNGGPGSNPYNTLSDFMLGRFNTAYQWIQVLQPYLKLRTWEYAMYVRDQWQVNRKLTVNYGLRWEKYPVPGRDETGIYFFDVDNFAIQVCGVGGYPRDCGIQTSNKIFAPSVGIAYRPTEKFVIRTGYSLSPSQENMGIGQMQAFPGEVRMDLNPPKEVPTAFGTGGSLTTGFPIIPEPVGTNGYYNIPPNTGNLSGLNGNKNYTRGYFQSYNFTIQKEFLWGLLGQVGYVGMHSLHLQRGLNLNYGTIGGGSGSMLLYKFGHTSGATKLFFDGTSKYNSLQATLNKRFSQGVTFQSAYTYSKLISLSSSVLIPGYTARNYYTDGSDRTHHIVVSGSYDLPFGKGKKLGQQPVVSAIAGGWSVAGIYNHYSGAPFNVTSSGSSCNCPNNTQTADLINPNVAKVGSGVGGQAYFDPLAYRGVSGLSSEKGVRFGTGGFNQLRGPGNDNIDISVARVFNLTERFKVQFRAEALNATNTAHFSNPAANASNMSLNTDGTLKSLNGFSQITSTNPLGRLIDQRYMRFALRLSW